MKHSIYSLAIAAAASLALTACSDDFGTDLATGDGVSYTVQLPGAITRAFGEGESATNLKYAVYTDAGEYVSDGKLAFPAGSMSVSFSLSGDQALLQGKGYKIAFFAYNVESVYTFDAQNAKVKVNYAKMFGSSTQSKDHDAFYGFDEFVVDGAMNRNVELTRPLAQVNLGTDDYDYNGNQFINSAYGSSLRTGITTTASDELNLLTGEANEPNVVVDMNAAGVYQGKPIEAKYGTFPGGAEYQWLTMNYLLLPKEAPVIDIKVKTYRSSTLVNTFDVTNVPVERNYRTNIYGSLLTSPANLTITKTADWGDNVHNVPVWRGEVKMPKADADGNYTITSAAELAGISQIVASGNTLQGKTVTLVSDLDLANIPWTPIGNRGKTFNGTFDGGGHVIKNLYISLKGKPFMHTGLFGDVREKGVVKNFTIDGANIDATGYTGGASNENCGSAVAVGKLYTGQRVESVTVKNATLKAYRHAGLICGHAYGNVINCSAENSSVIGCFEPVGSGKFDNCDKIGGILGYAAESGGSSPYNHTGNSIKNVSVQGYRHFSAVFGYVGKGTLYSNNTASNCEVIQNLDHNYNNITAGSLMGSITGWTVDNSAPDMGGTNSNVASNVNIVYPKTATTITEAITLMQQGGIVEAGTDLDFSNLPGELVITKPTTLIVPEGKTVTVAGNQLVNKSELTLKGGGNYVSTGIVVCNEDGGLLTIEDGNFTAGVGGQVNHAVYTAGSLIINGGTFSSSTTSKASYGLSVNAAMSTNPVYVEVNGGTFISNDAYALNLYGTGTAAMPATVVINGGTFIGKNGGGMASNSIDVTINGGEFLTTGQWHGFYLGTENMGANMSKLTINGGYFYGGSGMAIGANSKSTLVVKGGYVNKTAGFTPAAGFALQAVSKSITAGGKTWNFTNAIVKQ